MRAAAVARAATLAAAAALCLASPLAAEPSPPEIQEAPRIRQAIEAAIEPDTRRDVPRLPRVTIDTNGDVTVVLALRDEGAMEAIRAAARSDTLATLRAVYQSPDADRVTVATVVGTYGIIGSSGRKRELPVLRAVLSAERATQVDWGAVTADQVPELADVWWMHAAFSEAPDTLREG